MKKMELNESDTFFHHQRKQDHHLERLIFLLPLYNINAKKYITFISLVQMVKTEPPYQTTWRAGNVSNLLIKGILRTRHAKLGMWTKIPFLTAHVK